MAMKKSEQKKLSKKREQRKDFERRNNINAQQIEIEKDKYGNDILLAPYPESKKRKMSKEEIREIKESRKNVFQTITGI